MGGCIMFSRAQRQFITAPFLSVAESTRDVRAGVIGRKACADPHRRYGSRGSSNPPPMMSNFQPSVSKSMVNGVLGVVMAGLVAQGSQMISKDQVSALTVES